MTKKELKLKKAKICQNSNQCVYAKLANASKTGFTKVALGEWMHVSKNKSPQTFDYETWCLEMFNYLSDQIVIK